MIIVICGNVSEALNPVDCMFLVLSFCCFVSSMGVKQMSRGALAPCKLPSLFIGFLKMVCLFQGLVQSNINSIEVLISVFLLQKINQQMVSHQGDQVTCLH